MNILRIWHLKAVILALILVSVVGLALFQIRRGSSQHADRTNSLLIAGNRDRLAICVDAIDGALVDPTGARSATEDALTRLRAHRNWKPAGLDLNQPAVDMGCNAQPFLLQPGVDFNGGKVTTVSGFPRVATPSKYLVMIFVLPPEEIAREFGSSPTRRVVQEVSCDEGGCGEVTIGLYLASDELGEPRFLMTALIDAIGLEAPPDTAGTAPPGAPKDQLLPAP